ncbi:MAG: response regulator [Proteobacteria bacterium]|nr:response regulator [Pseudomonadota bacterium]
MADKAKILFVEDNDFVRMQIIKFLEDASFETLEATEGGNALEMMATNDNIALAIVDVRMEPVGGFEFVKELRSKDIRTPVILVTGDQNTDLLEKAGKLGISAVLMKPVQKDRLVKTVTKTIDHARRGN